MRCSVDDVLSPGSPLTLFNSNDFKIEADALDCSKALEKRNDFSNPPKFHYRPSEIQRTVIDSYERIFIHNQKNECKLSQCRMMKWFDCKTPNKEQTDVFIDRPEFSIVGITTNYHGYKQTFCFSCDIKPNGLPEITFDVDGI